jgi:hypothetical protein
MHAAQHAVRMHIHRGGTINSSYCWMQLLLLMDAALVNSYNTSSKKMVNSCNNSSTHGVANLKNSQIDKQLQRMQGTLLVGVPEKQDII